MDSSGKHKWSKAKINLGSSKSSHAISKLNAPSNGSNLCNRIIPTIRIVQIFSPTIVNTDPDNFRALVQKLTGKHSVGTSKKRKRNGSVCPTSLDFKNSHFSRSDTSRCIRTVDRENVHLKEVKANQLCASPSEIKRESAEEGEMGAGDYFSELFGEEDIWAGFIESGLTLPEIPFIFPPLT